MRARQAQPDQLGMYWSNQLSPTTLVLPQHQGQLVQQQKQGQQGTTDLSMHMGSL